MNVLDNWTKTFGLMGDENSLAVLQTLDSLPFVLQIFQTFPFGKYVKKMSKIGSQGMESFMDLKRIFYTLQNVNESPEPLWKSGPEKPKSK